MVHAIIFDMDGVLIDSQPMHYLGDQQTLAAHGVDVPVEAIPLFASLTEKWFYLPINLLFRLK